MTPLSNTHFQPFIYPPSCYFGESTPENLAFNTKIQYLAQKIAYIGGLEASGQLSSKKAYKEIKAQWKEFKQFRKKLKEGKYLENLMSSKASSM
jgi:hypothetical protein